MMHIVGDSAMSLVLSLMKQTRNDAVWRSKRIRFEYNSSGNATAESAKVSAQR